MPSASRNETDDKTQQGLAREGDIYRHRFSPNEREARVTTWRILCREFLQRYVSESDVLVDLGAGDGLFISHMRAGRRIAVDLGSHVLALRDEGIEVVQAPATELARQLTDEVDVVFMSNFLEHLPTKRVVLDVLEACHDALRLGGRLLILQPNIRLVGAAYWDYIDHHIALTDKSLVEAVELCGFEVEEVITRFLPYTAKSRLGGFAWLTGLYLKLPFLWRVFGKQTFLVARKK